ncbi:MAG: tRNA(adenine34) deaminase [Chloroflexota bacterium]|jgi:tRNA(adenine34) deaminase|nr:tRNA(adenine34) deaminase [Chloroflexota bacterium]
MPAMRYELYMGHALAEASEAASRGERPDGAVAVLDDAMVASGAHQVLASGDPTAHAVMVTVREAAARLGRTSLSGLTVFSVVEPCAMCVGALLASDADGLVYALPDPIAGACGSVVQLAGVNDASRRLRVVSGILREDAEELLTATSRR